MGEESKNLQPALKSEKEGKKTQTGEKNQENTEAIVMEGRVLGGCMDCLVNLLGTKYDNVVNYLEAYKKDGFLWFLESCDLNVFGIRRRVSCVPFWFCFFQPFKINVIKDFTHKFPAATGKQDIIFFRQIILR